MELGTESAQSDAVAFAGEVRAALLVIRALLEERQRLTDRLAVVQRDLDEQIATVRALEGRV